MSKLEVGNKVYLKAVGNNARYDKEIRIEEYKIKKVGRKYFEVGKRDDPRYNIKFHIDSKTQVTDYISDWDLYFSEQDILDENEAAQLTRDIRNVFDSYGKIDLSLEQLRKIKKIISQ